MTRIPDELFDYLDQWQPRQARPLFELDCFIHDQLLRADRKVEVKYTLDAEGIESAELNSDGMIHRVHNDLNSPA